jgi:excisionase family DNA binding protein
MNATVEQIFSGYLRLTDGDMAAAASLTLADALQGKQSEPPSAEAPLTVKEAAELTQGVHSVACRLGCDMETTLTDMPQDATTIVGKRVAREVAVPTGDRPLTVPEVAKFLRVRPDKVLSWVRSGRLRGYNVAERENGRPKYRVNPDDLQSFMQQRAVTQPAPKGRPVGRHRIPEPKWQPRQ